jgi:hypothetical protein
MPPSATGVDHAFDPECELCEAAHSTEWFYEDDLCWVAECEACYVPMVVWKSHDPNPPEEVRVVLLARLAEVARDAYLFDYVVDDNMRTIPTHFHAHARPRGGFFGHGLRRTAPR